MSNNATPLAPTAPMHTTAAVALAHLKEHWPATPVMATIMAVREAGDTPLDACSLVAALSAALLALDTMALRFTADGPRAQPVDCYEYLEGAAEYLAGDRS